MFVNDCCINSSFHLPIVLFSIAPAMFANCTNLRRNRARDHCFVAPQRVAYGGSYLFDTRVIFNISQSGPCELHQRLHVARLYKVVEQQSIQFFYCIYDNYITGIRTLCRDTRKIKVRYQVASPGDKDAFNFKLEIVNIKLNDYGSYRYEATVFTQGNTVDRVLTKHFPATNSEYNVYLCCLFLKVMISGE